MADEALEVWADRQARLSAAKMALSISATGLVKRRPGFGQTVRPAKGSVLAAPGPGDPDYFFHWLRDSAAVMEAVRMLAGSGDDAGDWRRHFADFVRFSLDLRHIDGAEFVRGRDIRRDVAPDMLQYVRPDGEIAAIAGGAVPGDVRYNADGTLDFIRWSRPQHDGPALRALVCLRFLEQEAAGEELRGMIPPATAPSRCPSPAKDCSSPLPQWERVAAKRPGEGEAACPAPESGNIGLRDVDELIRHDLDYTHRHAGEPCYDIWEEEIARHYYTVLVQFAALEQGARWLDAGGGDGAALRAKAGELRGMLDGFWSDAQGIYRSRILPQGGEHAKDLDFAVILGVLHAGRVSGAHSVADERVLATMARLEALFARDYAINRGRGAGLAFGRYEGDRYISGGAFYFSTWGAAEFYYRLAAAKPASAREYLAKGDAIFATAREFVPGSGDMSEQFDQTTGAQTSALNLAWSHAAFLTAWQARKAAVESAS